MKKINKKYRRKLERILSDIKKKLESDSVVSMLFEEKRELMFFYNLFEGPDSFIHNKSTDKVDYNKHIKSSFIFMDHLYINISLRTVIMATCASQSPSPYVGYLDYMD